MAQLRLYLSYNSLVVIDGKGTYTAPASSGADSCINVTSCESIPNTGPIPWGEYYLYRREINDPIALWDMVRNVSGDWGDWRVPLHAVTGTATYGRGGFFLHGGSKLGSAGCIDIGGGWFGDSSTNRVLSSIRESEVTRLWVM